MTVVRKTLCRPHTSGVPFGSPKFFYPGCMKCEEKLRAGLVDGTEGPLPNRLRSGRRIKPWMSA